MTNNQNCISEIIKYRNQAVVTLAVILVALFSGLKITEAAEYNWWVDQLTGAIIGVILASINVFLLGYAYYAIVLKQSSRRVIFLPIASFAAMCFGAVMLALYFINLVLGFAIGLTVPILLAAVIVL